MTEGNECPREATKQSEYSPSVVGEDEYLLRAIYRDDHLDAEQRLTTTNIPIQQIIEPKGDGFSVNREAFFKKKAAREMAAEFNRRNSKNDFQGFLRAQVKDVRALKQNIPDNEIRTFCVIDDGLVKNSSHALITPSKSLRVSEEYTKATRKEEKQLRAIRFGLITAFAGLIKVDEITV